MNLRNVAMIAAAPVSPSIVKLPRLAEILGPVRAVSLRAASKISNGMQSGFPSDEFKDFENCKLILICVPDRKVHHAVQELADSGLQWPGKSVVLCDSRMDSADMVLLENLGGHTGSIAQIDGFEPMRFVMEGHPQAAIEVRRFMDRCQSKLVKIPAGKKALYSAGLGFAGSLAMPLMAASAECLKKAGLTPEMAAAVAEKTLERTIRTFKKAGKQGWMGALASRDLESVRRQMAALGLENPILGAYFAETALMALKIFGEDAGWLEDLQETPKSKRASAT